MHSTRWLPRLGVRECAPTHSPVSSARGLPPAWDMLGRGGREELSDPRPGCGMPGVGCHLWVHLVRGRYGDQTHAVGSQGHQAPCPTSLPAPWAARLEKQGSPTADGSACIQGGDAFSLVPPCISAGTSAKCPLCPVGDRGWLDLSSLPGLWVGGEYGVGRSVSARWAGKQRAEDQAVPQPCSSPAPGCARLHGCQQQGIGTQAGREELRSPASS